MTRELLMVAGAYLLGAIPSGYLIVRLRTGEDVRERGSGKVGATNALRTAGRGAGLWVLLLDIGKGGMAVLVARGLELAPASVTVVAVAVVLGHMFPLFLGFRGGKGVATAAGALGALAWLPTLGSVVVFFGVVLWRRYVSLASILAVSSFPLAWILAARLEWFGGPEPEQLAAAVLIPLLVIYRHRSNIARLRAGRERRLGGSREPGGGM